MSDLSEWNETGRKPEGTVLILMEYTGAPQPDGAEYGESGNGDPTWGDIRWAVLTFFVAVAGLLGVIVIIEVILKFAVAVWRWL